MIPKICHDNLQPVSRQDLYNNSVNHVDHKNQCSIVMRESLVKSQWLNVCFSNIGYLWGTNQRPKRQTHKRSNKIGRLGTLRLLKSCYYFIVDLYNWIKK